MSAENPDRQHGQDGQRRPDCKRRCVGVNGDDRNQDILQDMHQDDPLGAQPFSAGELDVVLVDHLARASARQSDGEGNLQQREIYRRQQQVR